MSVNFLRLHDDFRDDEQRHAAQNIVQHRLADDRNQQECRYLMRFWWQLSMSYREVTFEELEEFVAPEKLKVIQDLLTALEQGHNAVDAWLEKSVRELPIIEDRGFELQSSQ